MHYADSQGTKPNVKSRWKFILLSIVFIAVTIALNLPYQMVEVHHRGTADSSVDFVETDKPILPRMAGWPFCYQISFPVSDSRHGSNQFSLRALMLNLLLVGVVFGLCRFYLLRRSAGNIRNGILRLSIGDLLIVTLMLAAPFGWWQSKKSQQKEIQSLRSELQFSSGKLRVSAWVPELFESRLPAWFVNKLVKVRAVRLEHPSEDLVAKTVKIPTISTYRIGGGNYDLRLLDELGKRVFLKDLRIAGRELDTGVVRLIGSRTNLDTLNLIRTNVTAEAMNSLGSLPRLRRLNLSGTSVNPSQLTNPPWAASVETLVLPHPNAGQTYDSPISIDGWPSLKHLIINELGIRLNETAISVSLKNLPQLAMLELDVFQKFDLQLDSLPSLVTVDPRRDNSQSRIARKGSVPLCIWLRKLDANNLSKLRNYVFYTGDITELQIRSPHPHATLSLSVAYQTQDQIFTVPKLTGAYRGLRAGA